MLSLGRKFNKEAAVSYIKAEEILPEELIRQIQEYADGVYIYIPRKPGTRHKWGYDALFSRIETVCTELKTAMFLTGAQNISALGKVRYYLTGTVREMTNK